MIVTLDKHAHNPNLVASGLAGVPIPMNQSAHPSHINAVWYVAITDFPDGLGSTARTRSLCEALVRLGNDVHLMIPYALGHVGSEPDNRKTEGIHQGIKWKYLNHSRIRPRNAFSVALTKLQSQFKIAYQLLKSGSQDVRCIFFYNLSYYDSFLLTFVASIKHIPMVLDITDEYHDSAIPLRRVGPARFIFQKLSVLLENCLFKRVQAIITVSEYFRNKLRKYDTKLFMLPAIIHCDRFVNAEADISFGDNSCANIVYAGNISLIEGIDTLIIAFGMLHAEGVKARLTVIGKATLGDNLDNYRNLINTWNATDVVGILPAVEYDAYPEYLKSADILIVPRPLSKFSNAGFPYKVAECLATGKPVIVTRFGDIELYLTDGVHCYLCEADNPKAIAETIKHVIQNAVRATHVAAEGQRRAMELFDINSAAHRLSEIMQFVDESCVRQ